MTTTGRLVTINDDAHHHEPTEAPAVCTKEQPLLRFTLPDDGPLKLQDVKVNDWWPMNLSHPAFIAPPGYEFVIRKVGHEIFVLRRGKP